MTNEKPPKRVRDATRAEGRTTLIIPRFERTNNAFSADVLAVLSVAKQAADTGLALIALWQWAHASRAPRLTLVRHRRRIVIRGTADSEAIAA